MIPYYITFLFSCIFCILGENSYRKVYANQSVNIGSFNRSNSHLFKIRSFCLKKPRVYKYHIYFFIAVLLVSILAGLRDYSIGTDIKTYGNDLFYYARNVGLLQFIHEAKNIEPMYIALVKISASLSSEPHMLYFLTGLIIYGFIMMSFVRLGRKMPITLSWLGFLMLLYGDTYNAMRQSLAISIGLYAFTYAVEKKYLRAAVWFAIAFLFHNTAIIMLMTYLIYYILQLNNKWYIKILLIIATILGVVFFNTILDLLIGRGILDTKMSRYYIAESSGFSVLAILQRLPFLLLIILQRRKFQAFHNGPYQSLDINESDFYLIALILEMFTVELSGFVASLYRISLFFIPFRCMSYARYVGTKTKKDKLLWVGILSLYLLVVFVYQNQIKGNNQIYPYIFGL